MTWRSLVFLVFVLSASPALAQFRAPDPAPGEQFHVEVGAMLWSPTPTIKVNTGGLAQFGIDNVDFVREFGIDDARFTELRVTVKPARRHKLLFSRVPFHYAPEAVLTHTIRFGSLTVPVTAEASADLQWTLYRFGYEWDFVSRDAGFVGLVGELKYNRVSADLRAEPYGTELTRLQAPVPTIGVIARAYPHRLVSVTGEFTGIRTPDSLSDTFKATFYDVDIYGTLSVTRHVAVQGGYRTITATYTDDDDTGDLKMKGLYLGGILRF